MEGEALWLLNGLGRKEKKGKEGGIGSRREIMI